MLTGPIESWDTTSTHTGSLITHRTHVLKLINRTALASPKLVELDSSFKSMIILSMMKTLHVKTGG